MVKQFVTYEIALKLKELGFNEECLAVFQIPYKKLTITGNSNVKLKMETINAPLYQQVIDWFREKHKYSVSIHVDEDNSTPSDIKYWYCIDSFFEVPNNKIVREGIEEVDNFSSFEEAREQAILKAIELIKK
jgi:hypothetical protein